MTQIYLVLIYYILQIFESKCPLYSILAWDQSDKFVKIYITGMQGVNNLPKDAFELNVGESSLFFKILELQGKNMIFELKETPYRILKESSYFKIKTGM